jgi:carbon monoxide dehydrogenase subunit G
VPEVEHTTTARLPVPVIWEFVQEMDNWAALVTGYGGHEKEGPDDSVWVLKGDVGVLARTVKFRVHVDEWAGPHRVVFSLKGVNEPMEGTGTFLLEPWEEANARAAAEPAPRGGLLSRWLAAIARFFYRLVHGRAQRAGSADSGPGAGMSRLTFRLRVDPGGPMAPMVNAMMKPMMLPAAEDLANRIMATLEERHGLVERGDDR